MKEKECKECAYYSQHYTKGPSLRYAATDCGHCTRDLRNKSANNQCKHWTLKTETDDKQVITNRLESIYLMIEKLFEYINNK